MSKLGLREANSLTVRQLIPTQLGNEQPSVECLRMYYSIAYLLSYIPGQGVGVQGKPSSETSATLAIYLFYIQ